jgi:hypothetical protein
MKPTTSVADDMSLVQQLRNTSIGLDDQLGQELIRQRVEVVSVKLRVVSCPQV